MERSSFDSRNAVKAALILLTIVVVTLTVWILSSTFIYHFNHDARINTIGQYTIGPIDCGTSGVVVEYGLAPKQAPILKVYPGTPDDRWQITKEQYSQIKPQTTQINTPGYLWIHCNNDSKKPEYFVYPGYFDTMENGMQVIIREK